MKKSEVILVSFSGGRTSAFLAKYMKERYADKCVFVFANTGKEREETLAFVNRCDQEWGLGVVWLEADIPPVKGQGTRHKVVSFETATRRHQKGPFDDLITKFTIPTNKGPMCTRELKINPVTSYMYRELGFSYWHNALGIRADEPDRLKKSRDNKYDFLYPLAEDMQVTEKFIRSWWDRQPFDLGLKDYQGNCDLCFKKSLRKRLTIIKEDPTVADWWERVEASSPYVFDREGRTIGQLRKMAEGNFHQAKDKHEVASLQMSLDFEKGCFCQST